MKRSMKKMQLVFFCSHYSVCCATVLVSETYNVALRNNIIKALSYHQEAMKISMSKLDQLLDAETKQYLKIQELGSFV